MKVCATCDAEYADTERFCPRDGTALRSRGQSADLVGSVIAERYHVLRKLGEGGMGQVYLVEHLRMRRKSAVKVMHPGMTTDADAISRFNREAANACQIDHPNVAAIYDFGESADGIVYLAMEFIEGESLARVVASRGALSAVRAADVTRQVADGLDAAHRHGIIHRDLKPDNILVGTHHDGRDRVKVVDFGISKAPLAEGQTVTHTGQIVGTPDYMSPEQLAGETLDQRSDIYSLAIVTFNMLTGALPFQSNSAQTSMLLRLTERPRRLSEARPDLAWPDDVQRVLDRAMDLDVARRYVAASEFASALSDVTGRIPVGSSTSTDVRTVLLNAPATAAPVTQAPRPVATAATSLNLSFPVASGLSVAELSAIEAKLAKVVGPIARVLVRRAAAAAPTREALLTSLAGEIDDQHEREQFRKSIG